VLTLLPIGFRYGYVYFGLFLKALKNPDGSPTWSIEEVNIIPTGGGSINVVFVWIWALLSDFLRTRWTLIVTQGLIGIASSVTTSIWTSHPKSTPLSAAYAGYFINYICLGTAPLIFAWLSDLIPQDPEARSLIVGVAVASYYAVSAWSQVLIWPASQAPYYKYGWETCIAIWILCIFMTCILRFVDVRYLRPKREAFAEALIAGEIEVAGQSAVPDKGVKEAKMRSAEPSIRGASLSE
jgi:MFS family permease